MTPRQVGAIPGSPHPSLATVKINRGIKPLLRNSILTIERATHLLMEQRQQIRMLLYPS